MLKKILFLALIPVPTFAQFSGSFSGKGQAVSHPQEKVRNCSEIFMSIKQDAHTLHVLQGGYNCQDMDASYPEFSLQIVNGKLMDGSVAVGTCNDDEIDLYKVDKAEDFTFHLQLKKSGSQVLYLEDWTDADRPALTVKGTLLPHQ